MEEKCAAGVKELLYSIMAVIALLLGYDFIGTAFRLMSGQNGYSGQNLVLTVLAVAIGCVIAYFVLTRYGAVFTYTAEEKKIYIKRRIGHREKVIEIKNRDIVSVSKSAPYKETKKVYKMCKSIVSQKNRYYLVYKNNGERETVIFEPSQNLVKEISKRVKEG